MKRTYWIITGIITVITIVLDVTIAVHPSYGYGVTHIPGFYILLSFAGCLALIFISKGLGKLFIQQKEDYYDRQ
jgi:uncharacterized membrane protein